MYKCLDEKHPAAYTRKELKAKYPIEMLKCEDCGRYLDYLGKWGEGDTWDITFQCDKCHLIYTYYSDGRKVILDESDDYIGYDDYEDKYGKPKCCAACGGPYPNCMDNCKLFED